MNAERDDKICEAYLSGTPMQAIGAELGISRERVRQILARRGVASRDASESWELQYQAWAAAEGAAIDETFDRVLSVSLVVAEFPETSAAWIRRYLEPRQHEVVLRSKRDQMWSNEDMIAAMRKAAGKSDTLSVTTYRRARLALPPAKRGPTQALIMWRFGSWVEAVAAAGLQPGRATRMVYDRRWSADDALDALAVFVRHARELGERPTFARYDEWSRTRSEYPSAAYVRCLTGRTWSDLLTEVAHTRLAA